MPFIRIISASVIPYSSENPRAIGADRIVDAVAAYEKYGGPALVLDFGTATTYDLVGHPHHLRQRNTVFIRSSGKLGGNTECCGERFTTYDLVGRDGSFEAGITAPGVRISAEAMWERTAMLSKIEIKKPKSILAQETISSMQAGLFYGQIGQTEYIIKRVREESGYDDLKVIATATASTIRSAPMARGFSVTTRMPVLTPGPTIRGVLPI